MRKSKKAEKITLAQAIVSIATVSFVDRLREVGGWRKGGDASQIRDMIRSENAGYMVADALLLAMSLTATLDGPSRVHLFDDGASGSDYESCSLTWPAYLYAGLLMMGTMLFGSSLCSALLNNIIVNVLDDDALLEFVENHQIALKYPLMSLQIAFFLWVASTELFCHFAYSNTFGAVIDVMSNGLVICIFLVYGVAVREIHNYTVDRQNAALTKGVKHASEPSFSSFVSSSSSTSPQAVVSQSLEISTECAGDAK